MPVPLPCWCRWWWEGGDDEDAKGGEEVAEGGEEARKDEVWEWEERCEALEGPRDSGGGREEVGIGIDEEEGMDTEPTKGGVRPYARVLP